MNTTANDILRKFAISGTPATQFSTPGASPMFTHPFNGPITPAIRARIMRLAQRNARICAAVQAGVPLSDAIGKNVIDHHVREQVEDAFAALTPPPPPSSPTTTADEADDDDDDDDPRRFARHDLRQAIAEGERFLIESRARNNQPATGPSIRVALLKNDGRDRAAENPKLWATAVHEISHAICYVFFGAEVRGAIAGKDGEDESGECRWAGELTPEQGAAALYGGRYGEYVLCDAENTRLQDFDPRCDGPQMAAALNEPMTDPLVPATDAALGAISLAESIIDANGYAINSAAKVLFDNAGTEVPGHSIHAIFSFHRGDRDDDLDEAATLAALEGRDWPLARGRARGLS